MNVLSLCQEFCPDKLPVEIGDRLGDGADGEVLDIVGEPDKVIKLGILYEYSTDNMVDRLYSIYEVIDHIIWSQPRPCVRVYKHGCLGMYSRPNNVMGEEKFIVYYYTMDKLAKLSGDEKKVFHSILSHEDRGIEKQYSSQKIDEILKGLSAGLDFDAKKVRLFCDDIESCGIIHGDLHPRNIMKTSGGDFKLIDLDRCSIKTQGDIDYGKDI